MYQGSNKTAICSQKNIAKSFINLLREKEYSKISVSEICSDAGISRQTFYSLFKSKENLVNFELQNNYYFDPEEECECCGTPTAEKLTDAFTEYIIEKEEFVSLLVKNNIMYLMQECLCKSMKCCDLDCIETDMIAACLTTIAKHYVLYNDKFSRDKLKNYVERVIRLYYA